MPLVNGYIVPNMPQPLLAPEKSPAWGRLREAYDAVAAQLKEDKIDTLLLYSTRWPSIIGHQMQADPEPEWTHVDEEFHELGEMYYKFKINVDMAEAYRENSEKRGLHARTVAYKGFPIDTGSIVALKLLNPDNHMDATIVSCNMYADRAETIVLGKAARDTIDQSDKRIAVIAVTQLSNRMFHTEIKPEEDKIHSPKDDEWNRKILEILSEGRLEDVSQLARSIAREANGDNKFKAIWWLAATLGQNNQYDGKVYAYEPCYGTGATLVSLRPAPGKAGDQEFDEDDVDFYSGDRNVLDSSKKDDLEDKNEES